MMIYQVNLRVPFMSIPGCYARFSALNVTNELALTGDMKGTSPKNVRTLGTMGEQQHPSIPEAPLDHFWAKKKMRTNFSD